MDVSGLPEKGKQRLYYYEEIKEKQQKVILPPDKVPDGSNTSPSRVTVLVFTLGSKAT